MCEVPFVSAIAFRRERIGDEWRVKVYSDLKGESREVPREIMSGITAQALSRKPVVVMRKNEGLYVFTLNTKPYLMMDGKFIEANTVKQIRINDRMGVGCGSSMMVYRRRSETETSFWASDQPSSVGRSLLPDPWICSTGRLLCFLSAPRRKTHLVPAPIL